MERRTRSALAAMIALAGGALIVEGPREQGSRPRCNHGQYGRRRSPLTGANVDTCLCGAQRVNGGEWSAGRGSR